jgi:hypothetical protein
MLKRLDCLAHPAMLMADMLKLIQFKRSNIELPKIQICTKSGEQY